jgi:hypothetical protein
MPGLWVLATFTPNGHTRPMGFVASMGLCYMAGIIIGCGLSAVALRLSHHRLAQRVANAGVILSMAPGMNIVLFFLIVFVRRLPVAD